MSDLWHRTAIHWGEARYNARGHAVMSRAEFEALRTVRSHNSLPSRTAGKALINGRWHMISREYSCGVPFYPCTPITIRLTAEELQFQCAMAR
jgi:hypothetical protein